MMRFLCYICLCFAQFLLIYGSTEISEEISDQEIFEDNSNQIHPYGRPVSVLSFGLRGKFIINNTALDEIFLHPEVKDRKIVAVSIIGAFRKGKSFLMDYGLRYMYGNYKSIAYPDNPLNNTQNWMGEPDEPLKGFSWKAGVQRDTNGIIIWSDVFLHEAKNKKFAIILMDTQGLFDTKTSPTENSRIFALGTLASSIQIFNLNDVILENQLEYLQLATEFSQFAMKKNQVSRRRTRNYKPFQKLIFLMRDWQNKHEYEYGEVGGMSYLTNVLHVKENQPEPLKNVRNFIKSSFEKLECFLMPHPGITVTSDPEFQGQRSALEEEFEQQLKRFLEYILAPEKLLVKKILNNEVSGSDFIQFLKAYLNAFESDDIPRVETLHSITIRKQFQILIAEAMDEFKSLLKHQNYNSSTFLDEINENGNSSMSTALKSFKKKRKLGGPTDEQNFLNQLKFSMESYFTEWKENQIRTHENLKIIEEERLKDLEEAERNAQKKLEVEQKKAQQEIENLRREQAEMERQMNETINRIKIESENKIAEFHRNLEAQKRLADQSNKENFIQLEQHNEELRRNVLISEHRFQEDYRNMKASMADQEKEIERIVTEKVQSKLNELKFLAEQKRIELEQQLKIEEMRAKAVAEDREWKQKLKIKELLIKKEAEAEKGKKYENLLLNFKDKQKSLQEMFLASNRY